MTKTKQFQCPDCNGIHFGSSQIDKQGTLKYECHGWECCNNRDPNWPGWFGCGWTGTTEDFLRHHTLAKEDVLVVSRKGNRMTETQLHKLGKYTLKLIKEGVTDFGAGVESDSGPLLYYCVKLGLIQCVPFDAAKHSDLFPDGEGDDYTEGDMIYYWGKTND